MPNHALAEIVAVEKQIQDRLAEERGRAARWLADEKTRLERETERRLAESREACREVVAKAETAAVAEVAEQSRRAEARAARLRDLPDAILREKLAGDLLRLLPIREGR